MRHVPVLALAAVLAVSACSSSSSKKQADTPSTSSGSSSLTIKSFSYNDLTVKPGETITVNNLDSAEHTVTSDTKGQFDADDIEKGTPVTFKAPTTPGKYAFHCTYHSNMHGTLTVS